MTGQYDLSLVAASFLVAVLASYSALYFGSQLAGLEKAKAALWLALGAFSMGTGIWVMHFVGMQAYVVPITISYDLAITAVSWLAAVGASGLALYLIGRERAGVLALGVGSLLMGGGITTMHYLGMAAIKMSPAMGHDPVLVAVSVAIAISASAVALMLCRHLQNVSGVRGVALQFAAALVMGVAICGMHYTGMAAMIYPENATPAAGNLLSGEWLGTPLALASAALILIALLASANDVKQRRNAELLARAEAERVQRKALYDLETGLPNRAHLANHLVSELARRISDERPFALIYLELANHRDLPQAQAGEVMKEFAKILNESTDAGTFLARYSASAFALVVDNPEHRVHENLYRNLRALPGRTGTKNLSLVWRAGQSVFPDSGRNSRMLVKQAMRTRQLAQLGTSRGPDTDQSAPYTSALT